MFRKATQIDISEITDIYNEIHNQEQLGLMTIGWLTNVYPIRDTAQKALNNNQLYVYQDSSGKILASAIINKVQVDEYKLGNWKYIVNDNDIMVLHTLVVRPTASKHGIGRKFVSFYESLAIQNGCKALRIDTNAKNTIARKFYHNLGYSEVGIVPCTFNGIENVQLVLLEKSLI